MIPAWAHGLAYWGLADWIVWVIWFDARPWGSYKTEQQNKIDEI